MLKSSGRKLFITIVIPKFLPLWYHIICIIHIDLALHVCVFICITNPSLKYKMKCLFNCVPTLGFPPQMFRQRTNQELAWSTISQVIHKDQEIPTIKNQAKDCTIPRQLSLKTLSVTKLGFWSTEASKGKFSSENEPRPQDMI